MLAVGLEGLQYPPVNWTAIHHFLHIVEVKVAVIGDAQQLAGGGNIRAGHTVGEHLPIAAPVRNVVKLFAGQTGHGGYRLCAYGSSRELPLSLRAQMSGSVPSFYGSQL